MNKFYTFAFATAIFSSSALAQQLPNADFEGAWVDCVPWNTANTTTKQGTTPESWCISNVVTPGMSAGNATIGEKKAGNASDNAVRVFNKSTAGQVIPGYFTIGTTWSTAKISLMTPSDEDGGSWGGIDFTYRPDALQFDFIHEQGSGSTQPATAVIYLWKGETQQADVPGANSYKFVGTPSNPATCTMINRDRNVIGMETIKGGAVTKSADFEKIAATTYSITTVNSDWETAIVPIEYTSTATPQKINVIFSACDYFAARSNHKGDDALTIDNVKLIYYSRLASLSVGGAALEGFASDTYDYSLEVDALPAVSDIAATCLGNSGSAKATVALDEASKKATITVTNAQGPDTDGLSTHTYTITFTIKASEVTIVSSKDFDGLLTVDIDNKGADEPSDATVTLNEYSDGTYGMYLADFGGLGAIDMRGFKLNGTEISGHIEGLEIAGGIIKANADVTGTYDEKDLVLHLDIETYDPEVIPVKVDFTTKVPQVTLVSSKDFNGYLWVDVAEEGADEPLDATVTLNEYSDGTYGMYLEDFGGLGAIDIRGLKLNGTELSGHVNALEIAGGAIKANADVTGTYDETDLTLHLDIEAYDPDVIPVKVDFTTKTPEEPGLKFRRLYTDGSSRYYNNISYTVLDKTHEAYSTANPAAESYYVAPKQNQWQEEGAYIDLTDKEVVIPVNAKTFTMILKSDASNCSSKWSQNAIFVDWNGNGEFTDEGETNGVINIDKKANEGGGGLVVTTEGETDVITLPEGLNIGDTFNMLIAMTEPKGTDGKQDLWNTGWEWTKEIFSNNVCSLINGQAYGLTLPIAEPGYSAIDSIITDASTDAQVEYFTIQGVRVATESLTPGIYIARQGNRTYKVIVK